MGNSIIKEFEVDMYILLYLKRITNKDLLLIYTTWNSAQWYVATWMRGGFAREYIHVYVWLSPFTVHLELSKHCLLIGFTPIQNKKFKKKFFNFVPI